VSIFCKDCDDELAAEKKRSAEALGADPAEIKRAFRSRAKATHPDRGGDAEEFALAVRAYRVLAAARTGSRN
jgi:hypothetical protein